ncbi:MAG: DNA-3-methyladenine glycosylase 2 family protein [Gammaproteobacteria bacterium]|nr:DNA-3-methyladenine glycosylase 2 family protein [Gammaproteobacteria bacterium]
MKDQSALNHALDQLCILEPKCRAILGSLGYPPPRVYSPGFHSLANIIISQQLSTHAATAIATRFSKLVCGVGVHEVATMPETSLREIGLSKQKIAYLQALSDAVAKGELDFDTLPSLGDIAAIKALSAVKGIGTWTAEIYLMFAEQRQDIWPAADLALQVAVGALYSLDQRPTAAHTRELTAHWSPFRSAGAILMWHLYANLQR